MATTAVPKTISSPSVGAYDRVFYTGMAIVMAVAVLMGFGPTYYVRGLLGSPITISGHTPSPLVHFHAALFTGWVVLFIVQTSLIARRSVNFHRKLGCAVASLAAGMFFVGTYTALKGVAAGTTVPGIHPFTFFAIPFGDMVMFASYIIAAMLLRRNKEAHKRLMLLAYISIVVAAVARFPGVLQRGPLVFYGLTMIFLAIAVLYDIVSRRRIHPAYIWGGGLFVASVPLRLAMSGTTPWHAFVQFLVTTLT